MAVMDLVRSKDYEIFEIHTLPRGLVALTLITKNKSEQVYQDSAGKWFRKQISIGSYTIQITTKEDKPEYANFIPVTKDIKKIHKRIDAIKEALRYPNLNISVNGIDFPPYSNGVAYQGLGLYIGIREDNTGKYYCFMNKGEEVKQYIS